jgi:hypothetical protein
VTGIVAVVLAVLFVVVMLTGRGGHGPGRHMLGGDAPAGVTHTQP